MVIAEILLIDDISTYKSTDVFYESMGTEIHFSRNHIPSPTWNSSIVFRFPVDIVCLQTCRSNLYCAISPNSLGAAGVFRITFSTLMSCRIQCIQISQHTHHLFILSLWSASHPASRQVLSAYRRAATRSCFSSLGPTGRPASVAIDTVAFQPITERREPAFFCLSDPGTMEDRCIVWFISRPCMFHELENYSLDSPSEVNKTDLGRRIQPVY
ncbi:hypothetical protein WA026_003177 [Henosepilachna vigintioctopunctata]|uniref:Uncharacterized protein n=1 Tax=Henosepilachna vigintioctopunctata TaxID=420089 RepID=A0AAW1TMC0_9CUCU